MTLGGRRAAGWLLFHLQSDRFDDRSPAVDFVIHETPRRLPAGIAKGIEAALDQIDENAVGADSASLRESLLDAVENPDYILASRRGAQAAVVVLGRKAFLHVFYVEKGRHDGFILSARVEEKMEKAKIVWRKENQEE